MWSASKKKRLLVSLYHQPLKEWVTHITTRSYNVPRQQADRQLNGVGWEKRDCTAQRVWVSLTQTVTSSQWRQCSQRLNSVSDFIPGCTLSLHSFSCDSTVFRQTGSSDLGSLVIWAVECITPVHVVHVVWIQRALVRQFMLECYILLERWKKRHWSFLILHFLFNFSHPVWDRCSCYQEVADTLWVKYQYNVGLIKAY